MNEGESKEVYGKYNVTDIKDVNGDGVPDTDTKDNKGTEDAADDEYGSDSNGDGKPDGDGAPDKIPDYADDGDNNDDGTVDNADITDGKNKSESSDFDNGGVYNNYVTCVKTMPNYVNKPTYRNATYYRYRTKTYINGGNDYKWSNCNDGNLKASGYSLTGNKK